MNQAPEEKRSFTTRDRWLTAAFVAGPWSALMDQMVNYSLSPTACEHGSKLLLHATSATSLLIALTGALIGLQAYRRDAVLTSQLVERRTRWAALGAIALSLFGALVIVAMELPIVILRSCD
jgi:uncharacterized membrane protein YfcA